ncbi:MULTISPECIES: NmrA family NAD(P)-binding protein [unclassified Agarivorans]|uniref:NmrA family NAD(P)-binding protein n=1 Tax=unclassified Agarivorans TaxID=2636026 RepID=UPI0026E23B05|nr:MULTISPECIES: NmrA family NAD(P)-binding protein [unclassified Agarivorans]MDO6684481.1 NmrA family NAD(P)-binding protein [Agarivorans sp. 3_MG-2023]MDO6714646.1 NmrA family NAD(P)-binding protein [Agarivorans sp. 2_MG-2023]
MKKVFVTSVTGAQGNSIAKAFKNANYVVASMTRKEVELSEYETLVGSFNDTAKLASIMKGSEAIIFTLPLLFDTQQVCEITQNIIDGAKEAGVEKIIFNSSFPIGESRTGYAAIDVKHDALDLLNKSGLAVVTLMPTIYLDNLSSPFLLPVINNANIVPYPISENIEFEWISLVNLGLYCVASLQNSSIIGEKILISNLDHCSKHDIAKLIGREKNTEVNYVSSTPAEFEENLIPVLGDYVAKEIANLYRSVSKNNQEFKHYTHHDFINSVDLQTTESWVKSISW